MAEPVSVALSVVAVASSGLLKAVLDALVSDRAIRPLTVREKVAVGIVVLGVLSIVISYYDVLWVHGPRKDWWEALHIEVGAALIFAGAVDTLLMARLQHSGQD